MKTQALVCSTNLYTSDLSSQKCTPKIKPFLFQVKIRTPQRCPELSLEALNTLCKRFNKNISALDYPPKKVPLHLKSCLKGLREVRLIRWSRFNHNLPLLRNLDFSLVDLRFLPVLLDSQKVFNKKLSSMKHLTALKATTLTNFDSLDFLKKLKKIQSLTLVSILHTNDSRYADSNMISSVKSLRDVKLLINQLGLCDLQDVMNQPTTIDMISSILTTSHINCISINICDFLNTESTKTLGAAFKTTNIKSWDLNIYLRDAQVLEFASSDFPFQTLDLLILRFSSSDVFTYGEEAEMRKMNMGCNNSLLLYICNNDRTEIDLLLEKCPALKCLFISRHQCDAYTGFSQDLTCSSSLRSLTIVENGCLKSLLPSLSLTLDQFISLEDINYSYSVGHIRSKKPIISSANIETFVEASSHLTLLKSFRLQCAVIDHHRLQAAQTLIGNMTKLHTLVFSLKVLEGPNYFYLPLSKLTVLADLKVQLSSNGDLEGAKHLSEAVARLSCLRSLEISKWELISANLCYLERLLGDLRELKSLESFVIRISQASAEAVVPSEYNPECYDINMMLPEERIMRDKMLGNVYSALKQLRFTGPRLRISRSLYHIDNRLFEFAMMR